MQHAARHNVGCSKSIKSRPAEHDAPQDLDEIRDRDGKGDHVNHQGHFAARKDEARQQHRRQHDHERELDGLDLALGDRRHQQAQPQRADHKQHGQRQQQCQAAVDRHAEDVDHHADHDQRLDEPDQRVGHEFSQQQAGSSDRRDEQLLERPQLPLADHGERRQEQGDQLQDDADQPGNEEVRAFQGRVVQQPRPHIDRQHRVAGGIASGSDLQRFFFLRAR